MVGGGPVGEEQVTAEGNFHRRQSLADERLAAALAEPPSERASVPRQRCAARARCPTRGAAAPRRRCSSTLGVPMASTPPTGGRRARGLERVRATDGRGVRGAVQHAAGQAQLAALREEPRAPTFDVGVHHADRRRRLGVEVGERGLGAVGVARSARARGRAHRGPSGPPDG